MPSPSDNSLYRPCVGIALFNRNGKLFVGERIDTPGAWQMPQGGIDPGEDIEKAAFRELHEEVGIDQAHILRVAQEKLRYDLPSALAQKLWGGRYRGQEQTWVAMRFTGQDSDIDIEHHALPEFSAWQWTPPGEILNIIVPFKRDVYRQVLSFFSDIATG